ncbi:MAG: phosphate ABC transporter substrate-binding protein [Anaerolineae bacterium]|jgi:phosphate transport system substrate-binding protein
MGQRLCWLAVLLVALLAGCGEPVATPVPVYLEAGGSMAMAPLVEALTAAFAEGAPTVSLEVAGLGTQFGLDALRAGEVDLALASWLPAEGEAGLEPDWQATEIARDGIAVVVHPDNPVEGLGLLQLQDLFGGRIHDWAPAGGAAGVEVVPVSREEGSGTRAAFEALVMVDREVTPLAAMAFTPQMVVEFVAGHPGAIGYVSMGLVTPEVKVVEIEGLAPTAESAGQGSYPITRALWLVAVEPGNRAEDEALADFVRFVLSPAGQQIVGRRYGRVR